MYECVHLINCHSGVTGVWSLPATVSHPNAWLPVLSPPYSSGHHPPSLATPSPKRTLFLLPHPSLSLLLLLKCVFLSSSHSSTRPANPIFHSLTSNISPLPPFVPPSLPPSQSAFSLSLSLFLSPSLSLFISLTLLSS